MGTATGNVSESDNCQMPDEQYSGPAIGVLLLHGLTGSPSEMRPIEKPLLKAGYRVVCPLLAGHGGTHHELLKTTWRDWLESVKEPLNQLSQECDVVVTAGLSVGALLAAMAMAETQQGNGLVMMSTTLGHPGSDIPISRMLLPLLYRLPWLHNHLYWTEKPPYGLKDERLQRQITKAIDASKVGETQEYGLFRTYVGSLKQLDDLIRIFPKTVQHMQRPALILHSMEDTIAGVANAMAAYSALGSVEKSIELISGCDHVMTVDLKKKEVAARIQRFIRTVIEVESQSSRYQWNVA